MQKDNGPVVNGTPPSTSSYRCVDLCDVVPASTTINYVEGDAYDTLQFGQSSKTFEHNSILFIPDLLSKQECQDLCQECEARVRSQDANPNSWLAASKTTRHENLPFERHEIKDLSQGTQTFFERLLRERLVPFISKEMPEEIEENLWENMSIQWCLPNLPLHTTQQNISFEQHHTNHLAQQQELQELQQQDKGNRHLAHQTFKFSESEPTINRYTQGGVFPPHRDVLAFTLNVLLSNQFIGGGTQFWEEVGTTEEKKVWNATATRKEHATNPLEAKEPTLCLLPKVGVGVCFNGTVKHAGRAVKEGVRHLLVVSFSVVHKKFKPLTEEFVERRTALGKVHGDAAERLRKRLVKRKEEKLKRPQQLKK